jgi:hypothetical protein
MRRAHNGPPFITMVTTSSATGANPPFAHLCLDSSFTLRPASESGRCTVGSMHYPPTPSQNITLSAKDPAPPQPSWPIQIP